MSLRKSESKLRVAPLSRAQRESKGNDFTRVENRALAWRTNKVERGDFSEQLEAGVWVEAEPWPSKKSTRMFNR